MAYRSAINESTAQMSMRILFGREMRMPCDLVFECKSGEDLYSDDLSRKVDDIH